MNELMKILVGKKKNQCMVGKTLDVNGQNQKFYKALFSKKSHDTQFWYSLTATKIYFRVHISIYERGCRKQSHMCSARNQISLCENTG